MAPSSLSQEALARLKPAEIAAQLGVSLTYAYEVQRRARLASMSNLPDPPVNQKEAILRALFQGGKADNATTLMHRIRRTGFPGLNDLHNLVHVVWSLQKQGQVTFYERRNSKLGDGGSLMAIQLTKPGYRYAEALITGATLTQPEDKEEKIVATAIMAEAKPPAGATPHAPTRIELVKEIMAENPEHLWTGKEMAEALTRRGHAGPQKGKGASDLAQLVRILFRQESKVFENAGRGLWRLLRTKPAIQNGTPAPAPKDEPKPSLDRQIEAARQFDPARYHQNEKPDAEAARVNRPPRDDFDEPFLLSGLDLIEKVYDKSQRRDKLAEAARMLEESGEDELALSVLARVELTPLESEVATLVGRIKGALSGTSNAASSGSADRDKG